MIAKAAAGEGFAFQNFQDVLCNDAHGEHPSVEFDWGAVEPRDEEEREGVEALARVLAQDYVLRFVQRLARYLVEEGRSKVEGAGIRAFVFAWAVVPRLGRLSQTQLASLMNRKHKQSVGREVSKFRDAFGWLGGEHMQSEEARAACRRRERVKRICEGSSGEGAVSSMGVSSEVVSHEVVR